MAQITAIARALQRCFPPSGAPRWWVCHYFPQTDIAGWQQAGHFFFVGSAARTLAEQEAHAHLAQRIPGIAEMNYGVTIRRPYLWEALHLEESGTA